MINITDAVYLLSYLFIGGAPPPEPYPDCGYDPTFDLSCDELHPECGFPFDEYEAIRMAFETLRPSPAKGRARPKEGGVANTMEDRR